MAFGWATGHRGGRCGCSGPVGIAWAPAPADDGIAVSDDAFRGADRWLAEQRADAAIEERRHAGWVRRRTEEGASLAGALVVAAEQGRAVVVTTVTGRTHRGTVQVVGDDAVVVATAAGRVVVAMEAVVTVRPDPEAPRRGLVDDERGRRPGLTLLALLDDAVAERAEVAVTVWGTAEPVRGTLAWTGADVLALEPGTVLVARWAVAEVLVAG